MKPTTLSITSAIGLCGVLATAVTLGAFSDSGSKKPAKGKVLMALDTLENQLQRRFHDRNNVSFGFERVVRFGARMHDSVVANRMPKKGEAWMYDDEGEMARSRQRDGNYEFQVAPNVWWPGAQFKQTMHPENDAERAMIATLRDSEVPVAIYTAGIFDQGLGLPARMKGPAYIRQRTPDAPAANELESVAAKGWASTNPSEAVAGKGWTYRVVKVTADDQSCIGCHHGQEEWFADKGYKMKPVKIGEPIGVFIIGTKSSSAKRT